MAQSVGWLLAKFMNVKRLGQTMKLSTTSGMAHREQGQKQVISLQKGKTCITINTNTCSVYILSSELRQTIF